jgi:hypothetical protein
LGDCQQQFGFCAALQMLRTLDRVEGNMGMAEGRRAAASARCTKTAVRHQPSDDWTLTIWIGSVSGPPVCQTL